MLGALALAGLVVGFLGFLLLTMRKPPQDATEPFDQIWHRYEGGDLTRAEFERAMRRRA